MLHTDFILEAEILPALHVNQSMELLWLLVSCSTAFAISSVSTTVTFSQTLSIAPDSQVKGVVYRTDPVEAGEYLVLILQECNGRKRVVQEKEIKVLCHPHSVLCTKPASQYHLVSSL